MSFVFVYFVQGRLDPKKHLQREVEELMSANINQTLGMMVDSVIF